MIMRSDNHTSGWTHICWVFAGLGLCLNIEGEILLTRGVTRLHTSPVSLPNPPAFTRRLHSAPSALRLWVLLKVGLQTE